MKFAIVNNRNRVAVVDVSDRFNRIGFVAVESMRGQGRATSQHKKQCYNVSEIHPSIAPIAAGADRLIVERRY